MGALAATVKVTDDPAEAREAAASLLTARPVEHTIVLTILAERIAIPRPGRYWWAETAGEITGFALRSPLDFYAALVPMGPASTDAIADAMAADATPLRGVIGEAATAARFAGRWTEHSGAGAAPREGQRLYRLGTLSEPTGIAGVMRHASPGETDLLVNWFEAFERDTGSPSPSAIAEVVGERVRAGRIWIWDDDGPACMAMGTPAVAGVSRVGAVYTPDDRRRRGYAAALVGRLSGHLLETEAEACVLFTQLANPTSNGVYRRLGYRPVGEVLTYDFEPRAGG